MNQEQIKKSFVNIGDKSLMTKSRSRIVKDSMAYAIIGAATIFTIGVLLWILGFIFINGAGKVTPEFLLSNYDSETQYVDVKVMDNKTGDNQLGITLGVKEVDKQNYAYIVDIESGSNVKSAKNRTGEDCYEPSGKSATDHGNYAGNPQSSWRAGPPDAE